MYTESPGGYLHGLWGRIVHVNYSLDVLERTQQTVSKSALEFLAVTLRATYDTEVGIFLPHGIPKLSSQLEAAIIWL